MANQSHLQVSISGGSTIERAGLTLLLASFPGIAVVPAEAQPPPRVMVWIAGADLTHPPAHAPETFLLALTDPVELAAFPPGLDGMFSQDESPAALAAAIRQVARGQTYLSSSLALAMLRSAGQSKPVETKKLSEREREILHLLAEGLSNKAIAARLYLSVRTVEGHLDKIYSHLGVHSRTEAVILAMQQFRDR